MAFLETAEGGRVDFIKCRLPLMGGEGRENITNAC
jgi:hypothetical protein